MEFDRTLTEREVVLSMKKLSGGGDEEEPEHDPDEVNHLYQEATMPIEDVISKYENAEEEEKAQLVLKNPVLAKLGEGSSGSGSKKPISPFLRGKKESKTGTENQHLRFDDNGEVKAEANGDSKEKKEESNGEAVKENGDLKHEKEEAAVATNGKDAKDEEPSKTEEETPKSTEKKNGGDETNGTAPSVGKGKGEISKTTYHLFP